MLTAVDAVPGSLMVVGHSAACSPAWTAADRRPGRLAEVVFIGGRPHDVRGQEGLVPGLGGGSPAAIEVVADLVVTGLRAGPSA